MDNPYAAPQTADLSIEPDSAPDEIIRKEHLKHEVSVKSIGTLYMIGGLFGTVIYLPVTLLTISSAADEGEPFPAALGVLLISLSVAALVVGSGVRRLKPWSRIPTVVLSTIGLLGFPVGTALNGYFLYLVLCRKGRMVLSERYAEVVRATPHIRYRTPRWLIALLLFFVLAAALLIGTAFLGR